MLSYQYRDSDVKDKTVSLTVLSLTWESPYLEKTVFTLRRGPGSLYIMSHTIWRGLRFILLGLYSLSSKTSNLVKSRSRGFVCNNGSITLNFDRRLGSFTAEVPVKFESDWKILNPIISASWFCSKTSYRLVNRGPGLVICLKGFVSLMYF